MTNAIEDRPLPPAIPQCVNCGCAVYRRDNRHCLFCLAIEWELAALDLAAVICRDGGRYVASLDCRNNPRRMVEKVVERMDELWERKDCAVMANAPEHEHCVHYHTGRPCCACGSDGSTVERDGDRGWACACGETANVEDPCGSCGAAYPGLCEN